MLHGTRVGTVLYSVSVALILGVGARAQEKPIVRAQSKVERLATVDLAEVGLPGTSVAQRVTIAPGTMNTEHTHTGRTSLLVVIQGSVTEVRGTVRREYKAGDVVAVSAGVTHFAENHGTEPLVYVEINTTKKE